MVFDLGEQSAIGGDGGAAVGDAFVADDQGAISGPGHGEFGLFAVFFDDFLVWRDPGEGGIQHVAADAGVLCLGVDTGDEGRETCSALSERGLGQDKGKSNQGGATVEHGAFPATTCRV